jgi:outer membrane immunogenic protein
MRTAALVSSILIAGALPAMAADLPVKARPMAPVVTAYNWTGCYIGGNVGGKWVRTSGSVDVAAAGAGAAATAAGSVLLPAADTSTLIAGGQVGCNYQAAGSNWVFGLEGDADWQRWSRTSLLAAPLPFPFITGDVFDIRSRWQASARGRIGYAWDRLLIYATGGAAFTDVTVGTNFIATTNGGIAFPATVGSVSKTLVGATVGGGFEYAFTNNFSAGIEGRYSWYGSQTFAGGPVATFGAGAGVFTFAPTSQTYKLDTFEVMGKLNFKIF